MLATARDEIDVFLMEKFCYYILNDVISSKKEGELVCGVRIFAMPTDFPIIEHTDGEGPFFNLSYLIQNSKIYEELKKTNSKRANKIILDKYISKIVDFELTEKDVVFDWDYIQAVQHSSLGVVKNGKLTGIHFYDDKRIKIIECIDANEKGVWSAIIEVKDAKGNWIRKEKETTFFPNHWDKTTITRELLFAVKNMKKKNGKDSIFESETLTGIDVEIVKVNGVMKTIYPVINKYSSSPSAIVPFLPTNKSK